MNKLSSVLLLAFFVLTSCASSDKMELSNEEKSKLFIESAAADLNENDANSALAHLRQAQDLKNESPELYYLLSLAYYRKHETEMAISAAKKALKLSPDFSAAKNALGKLLLDKGDLVGAEKNLKEAALDLTYPEAYLSKTNLGLLNSKKKNQTEAEHWFTKAIFDAGNNACMAFYYRGEIYFQKNLLEQAQSDFKRASKNGCANFGEAHLYLVKTLIKMKKNSEAKAKLIEIQQIFPSTDVASRANQYLKEIQ
jgi:Tfp pilus assembly protein PilF